MDIAAYDNLVDAAFKAARGKRSKPEVLCFFEQKDVNIGKLQNEILTGKSPDGHYHRFTVYDPKKRTIHAACFKDRVLHHALINHVGPVLERAMISSTFACRPNKGPLAASKWVQSCICRFPWYAKIDIKSYFDSIDHKLLIETLQKHIKGADVLRLIERIIASYRTAPGKGIPIGSLTSQHFANYYLDGIDRFLLEELKIDAHVRYMDDIVWWCSDSSTARKSLKIVKEWLYCCRLLELKDITQINKSSRGITFCGYRVLPGMLRLTERRKRSYSQKRKYWEQAYISCLIAECKLQSAYASVYAVTAHADSREWRKKQLCRFPSIEV